MGHTQSIKEHLPIFIIALIGIIGLVTVHQDIKTQRQSIPILQRIDLMENRTSTVDRVNLSSEILDIPVLSSQAPVFISKSDTVVGLEYLQ